MNRVKELLNVDSSCLCGAESVKSFFQSKILTLKKTLRNLKFLRIVPLCHCSVDSDKILTLITSFFNFYIVACCMLFVNSF